MPRMSSTDSFACVTLLRTFIAIDYYLKQAAQKVTMEIVDAQGKVIRTFTGTPENEKAPARPQGGGPGSEDEFFRRPPDPHPPVSAGLHRVNWDMRYPGATDFPGMVMWAANTRGPVAPPGTYQVKVTADGDTQTQSFAIKREPHILGHVTDQDLREQLDLAMNVRNKVTQAND